MLCLERLPRATRIAGKAGRGGLSRAPPDCSCVCRCHGPWLPSTWRGAGEGLLLVPGTWLRGGAGRKRERVAPVAVVQKRCGDLSPFY